MNADSRHRATASLTRDNCSLFRRGGSRSGSLGLSVISNTSSLSLQSSQPKRVGRSDRLTGLRKDDGVARSGCRRLAILFQRTYSAPFCHGPRATSHELSQCSHASGPRRQHARTPWWREISQRSAFSTLRRRAAEWPMGIDRLRSMPFSSVSPQDRDNGD